MSAHHAVHHAGKFALNILRTDRGIIFHACLGGAVGRCIKEQGQLFNFLRHHRAIIAARGRQRPAQIARQSQPGLAAQGISNLEEGGRLWLIALVGQRQLAVEREFDEGRGWPQCAGNGDHRVARHRGFEQALHSCDDIVGRGLDADPALAAEHRNARRFIKQTRWIRFQVRRFKVDPFGIGPHGAFQPAGERDGPGLIGTVEQEEAEARIGRIQRARGFCIGALHLGCGDAVACCASRATI